MRAVVVTKFGDAGAVEIAEVDTPRPGARQVRIRVSAAGVNPVDVATRSGALADAGLHGSPPVRLGWDVCGVVDALGGQTTRLRVDQRVIGLSDRLAAPSKAQAEFVVLDEDAVTAIPAELPDDRAAILPLAGLTAMQAIDSLALRREQSILITGAGGAVGALAVQIARQHGLRVIAAARERHRPRLADLGVDAWVSTDGVLAESVRDLVAGGVDGALDAAALGAASLDTIADRGAHVSLVVGDSPAPLRGIRSTSLAVHADWRDLTVLAGMVATGGLSLPPTRTMPLENVRDAHASLESGSLSDRIALIPA